MYKAITIRRVNNPDTRELMRTANELELGLRHLKSYIKSNLKFHKVMKDFKEGVNQKAVDRVFHRTTLPRQPNEPEDLFDEKEVLS